MPVSPPSIRRTPWTATRHRMDALYGRAFDAGRTGATSSTM